MRGDDRRKEEEERKRENDGKVKTWATKFMMPKVVPEKLFLLPWFYFCDSTKYRKVI